MGWGREGEQSSNGRLACTKALEGLNILRQQGQRQKGWGLDLSPAVPSTGPGTLKGEPANEWERIGRPCTGRSALCRFRCVCTAPSLSPFLRSLLGGWRHLLARHTCNMGDLSPLREEADPRRRQRQLWRKWFPAPALRGAFFSQGGLGGSVTAAGSSEMQQAVEGGPSFVLCEGRGCTPQLPGGTRSQGRARGRHSLRGTFTEHLLCASCAHAG